MRILEQTQDRLVLELRPVALMIMCVGLFLLFFVLGFGMRLFLPFVTSLVGVADMPGLANLPQVPGMNLLGYASVIPLLVAVFLLKTRRLTFDRGTGQVGIATRGMLGRTETSYPLADFRGATLHRTRSGGSSPSTSYRAVLQFQGQTVPVTPYGTGGSGPARTVETINRWLGLTVTGQGQAMTLATDQAAAVAAKLESLEIRIPR
jgi:hypothetical protein